jgi:putative transcriptional regulator
MAVLNRFQSLLRKKRAEEDRQITLDEVAKEVKLSPDTISRYSSQKVTRYDSDTVEALCRYFGVGVGDFLYLGSKDDLQAEAHQ